MQLATVPKSVITANQRVAGTLESARSLTQAAQSKVGTGPINSSVRTTISSALEAAEQAQQGAEKLGARNLLEGTFHRYAHHTVRDLAAAVSMLERSTPLTDDGISILSGKLQGAERSARLGSEAADRSLARPARRGDEGSSSSGSSSDASDDGPVWVDGRYLDGLGNPVRGGDSWAGPDGQRFGSDGSPAYDGGAHTGPDGSSYSGI